MSRTGTFISTSNSTPTVSLVKVKPFVPETRYSQIYNLCLCLYFFCTKLKCYIKPADVFVYSHFDVIKHMLPNLIL